MLSLSKYGSGGLYTMLKTRALAFLHTALRQAQGDTSHTFDRNFVIASCFASILSLSTNQFEL